MALWEEIAASLRQAIERGEYPPGSLIPKETDLMAMHGTGRDPVRRAVAQLTAEGLLDPRRRRGTAVRLRPPRERVNRSRTVYRDEIGYYFDQAAQPWRALRRPQVSRGPAPYDIAGLLGLSPGDEVIIRDRLMGDPATGEPTQLATTYMPAALAAELPVLAAVDTGQGGIYDRLEEAGHGPIRWAEAISARMPGPAEAADLRLPSGVPVLRVVRLATSPAGRPLEVNDTRLDAERYEIGYTITRHHTARVTRQGDESDQGGKLSLRPHLGLSRPPPFRCAGHRWGLLGAGACSQLSWAGATRSPAAVAPACGRRSQTARTSSGSATARALARWTVSAPRSEHLLSVRQRKLSVRQRKRGPAAARPRAGGLPSPSALSGTFREFG